MFLVVTPEQGQAMGEMVNTFQQYSSTFKGMDTPQDSVKAVLSVVENSSLEKGDGGAFKSHFGTKTWV